VETSTNPFDQGKSLVGLGNKVKKTPFKKQRQKLNVKKQRQKLNDRIEQEKDEDIKSELRKGKIVSEVI
jgi:hypothetical protein